MDLRETIISSFFFHLILLLLMAALSSFTAGFPGALDNIVLVNLTKDDTRELPAAETHPAEEHPAPSIPPSEEASLPDQVKNDSPVESSKIPEPEHRASPDTDSAEIQPQEKLPTQGEGSDRLEAYYQFIMLHRKVFGQKAGVRVSKLISEALKVNTRNFYGGTAIVSLKFGAEGELVGVTVDSESPDLKAFLEEVGWYEVPAPAAYLGHTVQIEFAVLEGYLSRRISIF